MSVAIEFHNVSKKFKLDKDRSRSFQELFVSALRRREKNDDSIFWALRDVSYRVEQGETMALIGSNGAGKSTSLKLISRIIQPTSGHVTINGRVTALLELGAGFHPELSGRDNIFLNAAVMGLTRKEIENRVDAIIDFAEMRDFIDVPVKNYSSGMYARLGFAVSVHLDPQILLVDEALSVGDQSFQQKCSEHLVKMRRKGVTIFLVSHSLETVDQVCARAIWMEHGRLKMDGKASKVTDAYRRHVLEESSAQHSVESWKADRLGSGEAFITEVEFLDGRGKPSKMFMTHEPMLVRMHYRANRRIEKPLIGMAFTQASSGIHITGPNNGFADYEIPFIEGEGIIDYSIGELPLLPGEYQITTAIYDWADTHQYDYWLDCARFTVVPGGTKERYGIIALEGTWSHQGR
jgi:lipopolysaccharide transport system ATP-binding protein